MVVTGFCLVWGHHKKAVEESAYLPYRTQQLPVRINNNDKRDYKAKDEKTYDVGRVVSVL